MLAAFALHSAPAVRIVLAELIAASILSVIVLRFFYPQLRRGIWTFQRQVVKSRPRLAAFTLGLFLVPVVLVLLSNLLA
jgi:hypothetical protein